ncbi:MAG: alpha/beta hydrolase [Saprospiraceae bacterium]|nr:alpha/beta hydrolase [Saprospiraceae bacterium]
MKALRKISILLIIAITGVFTACTQNDEVKLSENLRLRHKGADMPIWVRGNLQSRKILLYLHGGPGECSLCLREFFEPIEQEIAVVYWDQRMAGSASGNADPATLNYSQFAEDLEMVVKLLKQQYPNTEIYLFGHSFGVEMAWQFLTTGENQSLVKAFIALDGTYSTYDWLVQVREWVIREARLKSDTEAEEFMLAHPVTRENMRQINWGDWYSRMFRVGANPVWPTDDKGYNFNIWFKMPHSKFSQIANTSQYDHYYAEEIFNFDRSELLKNVRIPVALFWGAKDGIIPIEIAYKTRDLLTAPVTFVSFENSWHSAFHTENEKFSKEILSFVNEN